MIRFENVTHIYNINTAYEKKALDNININLDENIITGLIGKSGSGKSTFVQHFNNLLMPTYGKIYLDKKKIGLVFQYPEHQFFEMTVQDEIGFAIKTLDPEKKLDKILNALEFVGLDKNYLNKNPFELSGGEKRKVAIASVLVMQPEILILDEPTVGLDFKTQNNILLNLKKLNKKFNMTIIIISHDMNIIAEFTQKVIIMRDAKIIFYGDTCDAFNIKNLDLDLPLTKILINKLKDKNISVPDNIILFNDLVNFISQKIKENPN